MLLWDDVICLEPAIFCFHRKPKRNLGFETELPVSTYVTFEKEFKKTPGTRIEVKSHITINS